MQRPTNALGRTLSALALAAGVAACGPRDSEPAGAPQPTASQPTAPQPTAPQSSASAPSEAAAPGVAEKSGGAAAEAAPRVPVPRLLTRRELDLGARPAGVLYLPATAGAEALVGVSLEQTGEVVLWPAAQLGDLNRVLRVPVGGFPIGPIDAGGGRIAAASMAERTLTLFDPRRPSRATLEQHKLADVPRRLAAGQLGAVGDVLAVSVGPRGLVLLREGALSAVFELPTERSTALAFARDGSGLWFGSQSPTSVGFVPAEQFARDGGALVPSRVHRTPGIPRALAHVDFDGNGTPWLLLLGGTDDLFAVPDPSDAEGELAPLHLPAELPLDALALDVDGDGREELIALSKADSSYVVLGRPEEGQFRASFSEYSGQGSGAIAGGDVDGDGVPDLLVANRESHALALLYGRGPAAGGLFHGAVRTPAGRNPLDVALLDVRGDGRLGAASIAGAEGTLSLYANTGGRLEFLRKWEVGASPAELAVGDGDGDGAVDLFLLARPASGSRTLGWFGGPGGPLEREVALELGGGAARIAFAELAGEPWLLAADPTRGLLRGLPKPGSGAPAAELPLSPRPEALAAWPGGALAVVLAGQTPALVRVEWDGDALVERARYPLAGFPVDVACADLDGDGAADVVVLLREHEGAMAGEIRVFLARGDKGDKLVPAARATAGAAAHRIALGDIDRDGRADVAVAAQNRHVVHLWLARPGPTGLVLEPQLEVGVGLGPMAAALGDLTGDGWLDLVAVNAFSDDLTTVLSEAPR